MDTVAYATDASDAIIEVNDGWTAFAAANDDGVALLPPAILGRSLWDFIGDRTTKLLYERIFERVRGGIGTVRFTFRCDSPAMRRLLEMSISMQPAGALSFIVRPLRLEERTAVRLLDPEAKRSDALMRICGSCKRIHDFDGRWIEVEAAVLRFSLMEQSVPPTMSHGMCEDCHRVLTDELDDPDLAG